MTKTLSGWLVVLVAVLLGCILPATWWLMDSTLTTDPAQSRPAGEATILSPAAEPAPPTAIQAAVPERLESPPLPDIPAPVEGGVGDACRFTGRVRTLDGQPAAGALVMHLPDGRTLDAMELHFGLNEVMRFQPEQQARFARTNCDEEGRFKLDARFVASSDPDRYEWEWTQDPSLIVFQAGHAIRAHLCAGFAGGEYEAGEILIELEARLTGRVLDEGGVPIAGARITADQDGRIVPLGATTADDRGSARTALMLGTATAGADGRFMVDGLWTGMVRVWITAPGYVAQSLERTVSASGTADCGDITLDRGGRIEGVVLDQDSAPVPSARVFAHWLTAEEKMRGFGNTDTAIASLDCASRGDGAALTDAEGRFELRGLGEKSVEVIVDAAGFEPAGIGQVWPNREPISFRLERESRLVIEVVDSQGRPLEEALVSVSRWVNDFDGVTLPVASIPDSPGRFEVSRVGSRTYVEVSAPGFAPAHCELSSSAPGSAEKRRFELVREGRVVGHVRDAAGTPLRGILVAVIADPRDGVGQPRQVRAVTDAEGRYVLGGLPARTWDLRVLTGEYPDTQRLKVESRMGETVTASDMVLRRHCALRGRFVDGGGKPLAGCELFAVDEQRDPGARSASGPESKTRTGVDGRFVFGALRPSRWSIHWGEFRLGEFEVAAGAEVEVDLVLPTLAIVTGVLSCDDQAVGRGMVVALHEESSMTEETRRQLEALGFERAPGQLTESSSAATDADGRYELALDPGDYVIVGFGADPPLGRSQALPMHVEWNDRVTVDLTFVGADVAIVVSDTLTGGPIQGARLRPRYPDSFKGPWRLEGGCWPVSDAAGQLLLRNVPAGLQTVECEAPGYVARTVECLVPASEPLLVELEPCGTIRGVVAAGPGGVLPNYLTVDAKRGTQRLGGTAVGPGGQFVLDGLVPGECRLFVRHHGWDYGDDGLATPVDVVVKAGAESTVELTLQRWP